MVFALKGQELIAGGIATGRPRRPARPWRGRTRTVVSATPSGSGSLNRSFRGLRSPAT